MSIFKFWLSCGIGFATFILVMFGTSYVIESHLNIRLGDEGDYVLEQVMAYFSLGCGGLVGQAIYYYDPTHSSYLAYKRAPERIGLISTLRGLFVFGTCAIILNLASRGFHSTVSEVVFSLLYVIAAILIFRNSMRWYENKIKDATNKFLNP